MKLNEVAVGDTILVISEARGVTLHGTVTEVNPVILGSFFAPLRGDDWRAEIVISWPLDEIAEAKRRARRYLNKSQSNIADKMLLEGAMEAAFETLQQLVVHRSPVRRASFWRGLLR